MHRYCRGCCIFCSSSRWGWDVFVVAVDERQVTKGRFTRYDFCLRLSHAIFVARAARVMEKSYMISTISNCLSLRLS